MYTPATQLRLLSVNHDAAYKNTIWFPNVAAQTSYFLGKVVKTINSFNYIKKDNVIVVDGEVDSYYNCNYAMYQNPEKPGKWFYSFITAIGWASSNSTYIALSTDVIQTWFFDITYFQCFVERCHQRTDAVGDNIVPEPFTAPQVLYQESISVDLTPDEVDIFATCTRTGTPIAGNYVDGMYSGAGLVVKDDSTATHTRVDSALGEYVNNGLASAIARIQQHPSVLSDGSITRTFSKHPSNINGYSPKNNKLLSGAFITAYVAAYGQEINFNPEFCDNNVAIKAACARTSGQIIVAVTSYGDNNTAAMSFNVNIPESTWAYNQYKNDYNLHSGSNAMYIERSGIQRTTSTVAANIAPVTSALSGVGATVKQIGAGAAMVGVGRIASGVGTLVGAAGTALNTVSGVTQGVGEAMIYDKGIDDISQKLASIAESYNAPAVGGVSSSNGFIAAGFTKMSAGYKVPPAEFAKKFDNFLTVYGYAQNDYMTLNLHARSSWTYIKVKDFRATGNFPDNDMAVIDAAFKNGIFFWSYTATYGNFNASNSPV